MKTEPELYKPAEACKMAEVAPYVLRYWETEFPVLSERKDKGPARLYSGREVRIISRIRELLYDEGFTVAGAKKRLEAEVAEGRFEEGLATAPSVAAQKRAAGSASASGAVPKAGRSSSPQVETSDPLFLSESPSAAVSGRPAPPAGSEFPDRKRVLRELKEIARILDRVRPKA